MTQLPVRDLTRWWPLLLLLIFGLGLLGARIPPDPLRQQQGLFIQRCSDAFNANHFAVARQVLSLPTVSNVGFRIMSSGSTMDGSGQQAVFPVRVVSQAGEVFKTFVCLEAGTSVTFRLARPDEIPLPTY